MQQRNGAYYLAISILVFADLCYTASNEYSMVSSLLNEARALRISGDVYKADGLLTRAQRIAPRSADVYLEMAYLRKAQGDYTGLREVVDFGADIADGPPASISQLRILRDKLTVLLPLDSETPFQLPPAVAVKDKAVIEEMPRQSKAFKLSLDSDSEKSSTDSTADENLVRDSYDFARENHPKRITRQAQSQEKHASVNVGGNDAYQQSTILERDSDKPENSEAIAASIVRQRSNEDSESSGAITATEKVPVTPKAKEVRTHLVGVGVLARSQSGSWISRGSIEREY